MHDPAAAPEASAPVIAAPAAAVVAPAQATPAALPTPPAPAAHTPAAQDDKEPHWLADRLRREGEAARKAILKDLGVENPKDAKAALDAYKADQEAKKSELQKAQEKAAAHEAKANERDAYRAAVEAQAQADLAALTPEQRAFVEDIAGDDPLKIAMTIRKARPTWAVAASPAAPAGQAPPAVPPIAAPASTAPPNTAPRPTTARTKFDEFADIERTNPKAAGLFYSLNQRAIEASRPST